MTTFKVARDDRCPAMSPYGVIDKDSNEVESCHANAVQAQAAAVKLSASGEDEGASDVDTRADNGDSSKPYGDVTYADPGYQQDGVKRYPIDTKEHAKAAWGYINQAGNAGKYSPENLAKVKGRIKAAAKRFGIEISDNSNSSSDRAAALTPLGPIETRESEIAGVNFKERIITTIAVPYEQTALVPGGQGFGRAGEVWREVFSRGAFASITSSPQRIRANRDHDKARTVGKVMAFYPERNEGLVAEVRMAKTPLGDETLELADADCLGASVGFATRASGQHLDRFTRTRRVNDAYLDHLAFVASPAYEGANVLSVRHNPVIDAPPTGATPALDYALQDPVFLWAAQRLNRM